MCAEAASRSILWYGAYYWRLHYIRRLLGPPNKINHNCKLPKTWLCRFKLFKHARLYCQQCDRRRVMIIAFKLCLQQLIDSHYRGRGCFLRQVCPFCRSFWLLTEHLIGSIRSVCPECVCVCLGVYVSVCLSVCVCVCMCPENKSWTKRALR